MQRQRIFFYLQLYAGASDRTKDVSKGAQRSRDPPQELRKNKIPQFAEENTSLIWQTSKDPKPIPLVTKSDLVKVYNRYIRAILEYNAPVFASLSIKNSEQLERISIRYPHILCGL